MDIINKRYKITRKIENQLSGVQEFLAQDLWSGKKRVNLRIMAASNIVVEEVLEILQENFIILKNISHHFFIKNYGFANVSHAGSSRLIVNSEEKFYVCTTEIIKNKIPSEIFIQNCKMKDLLEIVIFVSQTIIHINNLGFSYNVFTLDNIFVIKKDKKIQIKIKDIISTKLENPFSITTTQKKRNNKNSESIMTLIISLLVKKQVSNNYNFFITKIKTSYKNKNLTKNEKNIFNSLINVAEKILRYKKQERKIEIPDIILDINKSLNSHYTAIKLKPKEALTFHPKMTGRKKQLETILDAKEKIELNKPTKSVFIIRGPKGLGKTRFLHEIDYKLSFRRTGIYTNYKLQNDPELNFWQDFLEKTLATSKQLTKDKNFNSIYENLIEYNKFNFNKATTEERNELFKIFIKTKKLLVDTNKKVTSFLIIDDLHLANDSILQGILYLTGEVIQNDKMGIIFSYDETAKPKSNRFKCILDILLKHEKVEIFDLNNLSKEETNEMIQNILLSSDSVKKFSDKIYSQNFGHPKLITDSIKELIEKKLLYKNKINGKWNIIDHYFDEKHEKSFLLKQNNQNLIKNLSANEKNILKHMSLFNEKFDIYHIYELTKISKSKLSSIKDHFLKERILCEIKTNNKLKYAIRCKGLKNNIYENIPIQERKTKHKKIINFLKKANDENLDELIWHLENSGQKNSAIKLCNTNAEKYFNMNDFKNSIKYYKKINLLNSKKNIEEHCKVLLKIFQIYNKQGLALKASEVLDQISKLINSVENAYLISEYYYLKASQAHKLKNIDEQLIYLEKQEKIYNTNKAKIIKLRIDHTKGLYYQIVKKRRKLENIANIILETVGDEKEYEYFKFVALIFLGYTSFSKKKYLHSHNLFTNANELAKQSKDTHIELVTFYNVLIISLEIHEAKKVIKNIVKEILLKSNQSNFIHIEINTLIKYACFLSEIQENTKAYKYAKKANNKANKHNITTHKLESIILLIQITGDMNNYKKMNKYKKEFYKLLKDSNKKIKEIYEKKISLIFPEIYQSLYDYDKMKNYILKNLAHNENEDIESKLMNFRLEAIKIIKQEKNTTNNLYKIFEEYETIINKNEVSKKKEVISKILIQTLISLQIERPDLNFDKLIFKILKFKKYCIYNFQKIAIIYLESCITKKNKIKLLKKVLYLSNSDQSHDLISFVYIKIAFSYMQEKKVNLAILNFLEAKKIILKKINKMPKKYIKYFFSNPINSIPFEIINMFLDKKDIYKYKIKSKKISEKKIISFIKTDNLNLLVKQKNFKKNLINENLSYLGYDNYKEINIYEKIGYNYKKNILHIMEFISINLLANNFEILLIDDNNRISTLFKKNIKDKKIQKIYSWLRKNSYEQLQNFDDYFDSNSIIIPIKNNHQITNNIQGIIVFTSNSIINNFSKEGLEFSKNYLNLIKSFFKGYYYKNAAIYDELTGSLTRKYFEILLENIYNKSKKNNTVFSLIIYDIDHFKKVNDTYGHHIGDIVLKTITSEVLAELDSKYNLVRYGGEEFFIILPDADKKHAFEIAERIRKKIELLNFLDGELEVTISLGISTYSDYDDTANKLLLKADQALYNSKNTGRNKSCSWSISYLNTNSTNINSNSFINNENNFLENVSFLTELMSIAETQTNKEACMQMYLYKINNFFTSNNAAIIYMNNKNKKYKFKICKKIGFKTCKINENLLETVVSTGKGIAKIDWDDITNTDSSNSIPEWNSVMIAPLIKNENMLGFLYLSIDEKQHEFNYQDLNTLELFANIVTANL